MPILHIQFEAGTTGEVEFICPYLRLDQPTQEVLPAFSVTEPIVSDEITVELPSGLDPLVTPNPWSYTVKLRLNGQDEYLTYITMPLTDAEFYDLVQLAQPVTPEYFVLKADYVPGGGGGGGAPSGPAGGVLGGTYPNPSFNVDMATQAELNAEITARGVDVDTEQGRAEFAEAGLDARIDANETDIANHETRLDGLDTDVAGLDSDIAAETTARIADVDAEQTRASGVETTLAASIATEVTNRTADVDAEEARALAAEGVLAASLTAEITNRVNDVDAEEARATAAEALLAPKASPTFTGDPKAPNQTAGDNDTSIANTAFVTGAVSTHAGATDPHGDRAFATTAVGTETTNRIADVDAEETRALAAEALLAPKASPTFTGTVTVPTPTSTDNTTKAASTAFVQTNLGLYLPKSFIPVKGDLIVGGTTVTVLNAGADGTFLRADSTQASGLKWDALTFAMLPTFPRGSFSSSAESVSNATDTVLGSTTGTTISQTHAFHSDVTNRSRLTIPSGQAGDYMVFASWNLGTTAATGDRRVRLLLNGSTLATILTARAAALAHIESRAFLAVGLAVGDYLEMQAFQNAGGGAVNMTMSLFAIVKLP